MVRGHITNFASHLFVVGALMLLTERAATERAATERAERRKRVIMAVIADTFADASKMLRTE